VIVVKAYGKLISREDDYGLLRTKIHSDSSAGAKGIRSSQQLIKGFDPRAFQRRESHTPLGMRKKKNKLSRWSIL
jgi:hypothetical protein